ncbi:MAG: hypothetical protein WA975_10145 [Mesorhizobium sp.]
MTHSIDFKGIEERLFLIQKVVLGSRAYCEERDIGRTVGRYGEGEWSDYSYRLQELISSYAIECAIKTRMVQDLIAASSTEIDMANADSEARDGFEIGVVHSGSFNLTVRESCNKIIHATKVELGWATANLRKAKKKIEYWSGSYHLHGKQGKTAWHVELDMQVWAIAMENFHSILDEQADWERIYGL